MAAVVERNVEGIFGPGIQQPFPNWIFAHDARDPAFLQSIGYFLPGFPGVARAGDIRMRIATRVIDDKGFVGLVTRGLDGDDLGVFRQVGRSDIGPGLGAVVGGLNQTITGT